MRRGKAGLGRVLFGAAALMLAALPVRAADFYAGKTISIITSTGVGGTYDLVARSIAHTMPEHIPGHPSIIVQNMPGGGNLIATNYMYNVAAKDGTVLATINNGIPLNQVIDPRGVYYDADKFNWIGSTGAVNSVTIAWRGTGITSIQDVMHKQVMLGGTGPGSAIDIFPMAMNNVLGTKFKIVNGYKSSTEIYFAMEKGEVEARSGGYSDLISTRPEWIRDKKIVFLVQVGAKRDPTLPDVPLLTELAKTDEQRQILKLISSPMALGQPFLAPPGVPAERLAILRAGFAATLRDPIFLAEMKKVNFAIDPMTAEDVAAIIHETTNAPPDIVAKTREALETPPN